MSLVGRTRHRGRLLLGAAKHFIQIQTFLRRVRRKEPRRRTIAIAMIEHLGDIVACEPIARRLRTSDPQVRIVWLVKKSYRELLVSNPNVDLVVDVHCLSEKDYLLAMCSFDQVLDLHFTERRCTICNRVAAEGPDRRLNTSGITLSNFYQHGGILNGVSLFAGLGPMDDTPRVYLDAGISVRVDALSLPGKYVVFHCCSRDVTKDLPVEKWIQLLRHVQVEHRLAVIEVGLHRVLPDLGVGTLRDLTGILSIRETAETIRRGVLFVGVDSGPAHLASAVGTDGVVLLGEYMGHVRYNPFSGEYRSGAKATLVFADGPIAGLSVDKVKRQIDLSLGQLGSAACPARPESKQS